MKDMKNMTKHMYQDGNDLVVVYTNVFNNGYSLENMIQNEIKNQCNFEKTLNMADFIEPIETATVSQPEQPVKITFGYIDSNIYRRFIQLGGKSEKMADGKTVNFVTSEELAQKIENELGIKRNS
jgi:hypothetical protein